MFYIGGWGSGGTLILGVSYQEGMLSKFRWKCYVLYWGQGSVIQGVIGH